MAPNTAKKTLFDDSEDESDGGASIKVNEEYAKRFEHNKKREERQRLEEKYKNQKKDGGDDASDSSSDESEDEDGFLATEDLDAQISATLEAIRNKDPRIYDGKTTFYKPVEESTDADSAQGVKKEKPVYLQDYHRQRILAGDTGADEEPNVPPKTYAQEQDELKQSLANEIQAQMQGDDSSDSDDDFLKAKAGETERVKAEIKENGMHPSRAAKVTSSTLDVANADKDPQLYLSNFMNARAWTQPSNNNGWEAFESDNEEEVGKADEWEAAYNMRFEDPNKSNEVLKSYARDVADAKSVRRDDKTARKRQREQERAEKEAAKQERREERARLRKLKIEEAEGKLKQIKKAAGLSGKTIKDDDWVKFLDDAWDNDKWQEEMTKAFGDQYYAEGEGASGHEEAAGGSKKKVKKPKWDDDIDIKDLVPDFDDDEKPQAGLSATEADGEVAGDEGGEDAEGVEDDEDGPPPKRQKTTKDRKKEKLASQKAARQERAKIEALVDAKMDIDEPEALTGSKSKTDPDIPKFSYRETWAESYGLTARDILMAPSDAALNEFVGLKKLAHFRPADKKAKDKKRLGKKARLRQWRRETFGPEAEKDGPEFAFGEGLKVTQDGEGAEESNIIEGSKKRKRRSKKKKAGETDI